jgi:hypothetical protein
MLLSVASVVLLAVVLGLPVSAGAASAARLGPRVNEGTAFSLNWAGYAVTGSSGAYNSVAGSRIQPSVACGGGTSYAALWAGIDGYNSNTVEQAGTLAQCSSGHASYSAWYEFYPAASVTIPTITVHPGDVFSVTVTYSGSGSSFSVTVTDVTTGASFSSTGSVSSAARSSAECIMERPSIGGSITRLADFNVAKYGNGYTSVSGTCDANGHAFGPGATRIVMVSNSGRKTLAQPSALNAAGDSFTVTWKGSG